MNVPKSAARANAADGMYADQRVGIFIDVGNLYHSAKNIYRGRVNYRELLRHLVGGRRLIRAVAYVIRSEHAAGDMPRTPGTRNRPGEPVESSEPKHTSPEAAFFEALEKTGLELRSKDLQVYADGLKKGDWDVGLTVDAIRMASFLDVVVLVTGDGDFVPLVNYLKWGLGRFVEVAAFERSASAKLRESADRFTNIEDIPRVIMRKPL